MSGPNSLADKPGAHPEADQMAAAREAFEGGDYSTAFEIWGPLAHAGVSQAQAYIGTCFAEGWGIERDFALERLASDSMLEKSAMHLDVSARGRFVK